MSHFTGSLLFAPSLCSDSPLAGRGSPAQLWEAASGFPDELTTCGVDRHILPGNILPFAHGAEALPHRTTGRCAQNLCFCSQNQFADDRRAGLLNNLSGRQATGSCRMFAAYPYSHTHLASLREHIKSACLASI